MKRWKQGVLGKIAMAGCGTLFMKCLKYPLATFHERYDPETRALGNELFRAFLDLSTLKFIERIGSEKLTPFEKKLCGLFTVRHGAGTSDIESIGFDGESIPLMHVNKGEPCSLDYIQERYSMVSGSRRI